MIFWRALPLLLLLYTYKNHEFKNQLLKLSNIDDLIEDILQFLNFDDKIRLQCVSHQWNRCLFAKQTVLVIDGSDTSDTGLDKASSNSLNNLVYKTPVDSVNQLECEMYTNRATKLKKSSFESVLKKCSNWEQYKLRIR